MKFLQGSKVPSKVLTAFTRQLATLIDAGLPLLRGLDVLRKQEKHPVLRRTLTQLAEAVEGGSTFSEALAQHPKVFNKLYVNMVRAGEAGGVLDVTLNRLAEFQEKAQRIKGKIIAAMVYPTVIISVALGIVVFLMVTIVPKFQEIFKELLEGAQLPTVTQLVLNVSNIVQHQFVLVIAAVAGVLVAVKLIGKTVKGRYAIDTMKLACSRVRSNGTQGRHCPVCSYAWHAGGQWCSHFAGAQYRPRYCGECRARQGGQSSA